MIALASNYDAALFDLDGVIYLGPLAIDGVPEALDELRSRGTHLGFVTNNAARTPAVVAEHLTELGITANEADVVNSTQATLRMLGAELAPGAKVLAVGTDALRQQLQGPASTSSPRSTTRPTPSSRATTRPWSGSGWRRPRSRSSGALPGTAPTRT